MIMNVSYRLGFATIGVFVFISLSTVYWFFLRGRMEFRKEESASKGRVRTARPILETLE
jgi:hypothetical protein